MTAPTGGPADYRPPADARASASLLLLRDGGEGLEVLMLRRAERAGDMRSGLAVFPGGVLDPRDRQAHGLCLGPGDAQASAQLGLAEGGLDYLVAAVRETFEEVGLLLARVNVEQVDQTDQTDQPDQADPPERVDLAERAARGERGERDDAADLPDFAALRPWRQRLQEGSAGIAEFCTAAGLRLDLRGLAYFGHWLTPPGMRQRFDTRFFLALAPAGQQATADGGEALALMWLTPRRALDPRQGLQLLPVTRMLLQQLAGERSAGAALQAARAREAVPLVMPRRALTAQGPGVVLPHEWAYAEVARLDPEGRGDHPATLAAGRAVALSPRVIRVTAPNPGPMTGPGTNSYLVGGSGRWTVIDPGPDSTPHLQALLAALAQAGGVVERILVTHTHRDHSPGAAALAQATGAPVWGRLALHPEGQDGGFAPQHQPRHGDRVAAGDGAWLRVLHTPGHASNHLCYLLEEERLLFTGDHVMQGSTVVINPPDGDMAQYLQSLQQLLNEPLDWLAPGHGFLVGEPHAVLRGLIAHRRRRESKLAHALQAAGCASEQALLAAVYDDVPQALHPVAARSLLAHLLKLQAEGRARRDGKLWSSG